MPRRADTSDRSLVLWAGEVASAPAKSNVVLWRGPAVDSTRAITDLVEENADEIRSRYLAWLQRLGNESLDGRAIRQSFSFSDGLDLWSQSAFVEQSPWKLRSLEPILKMMAFEMLLDRERPVRVTYVGADHDVSVVTQALCRQRGIAYRWNRLRRRRKFGINALLRRLPNPLQGTLLFGWLAMRVALPRPPAHRYGDGRRRVLVAGPLFNFDVQHAAQGEFTSAFWTKLPDVLAQGGYDITWLHYFYKHANVRTSRAALNTVGTLNLRARRGERHELLDSYFTLSGACRVLTRAIRVGLRSVATGHALQRRFAGEGNLGYWPLLRADWARAFRGIGCVENLFLAECFNRALAQLPRHDEGLYLLENQGWERALAAAWKRYRHGRLAGVVHSTIRFWDLRYHREPDHYDAGGREPYPGPDVAVMNGAWAHSVYLSSADKRERVVDCEALRYLHLFHASRQQIAPRAAAAPTALSVLVLGDYLRSDTDSVLQLLQSARQLIVGDLDVRVKPHPNCPVDPARFPALQLSVVQGAVADLARKSAVTLAGNLTSAAVDAYASGAHVLVHHDGAGLNFSPLRGIDGVRFVRSGADLARILQALAEGTDEQERAQPKDFFYIDTTLPRWRRYFEIARTAAPDRDELARAAP